MRYYFIVFVLFLSFLSSWSSAQSPGTVRVALPDIDIHPFIYEQKNHELAGYVIEMYELIFKKTMGFNLEYIRRPWPRAQMELARGNADVMFTYPTKSRLKFSVPTHNPVSELYYYLYLYKDHPLAKSLDAVTEINQLEKFELNLASYNGDGWFETVVNCFGRGSSAHYLRDRRAVALFVADRRADGFVDNLFSAESLIKDLNLEDHIRKSNVKFGPIKFHLMVGKQSFLLDHMEDVDDALEQVSEEIGEIRKLMGLSY